HGAERPPTLSRVPDQRRRRCRPRVADREGRTVPHRVAPRPVPFLQNFYNSLTTYLGSHLRIEIETWSIQTKVRGKAAMLVTQSEFSRPERYQHPHLEVDFARAAASLDSRRIVLTRKEYELLSLLVQNAGEIIPREALLWRVWGYNNQ